MTSAKAATRVPRRATTARWWFSTDYTSTQIALSTLEGTTQSAAFLSTASTTASGARLRALGRRGHPAHDPGVRAAWSSSISTAPTSSPGPTPRRRTSTPSCRSARASSPTRTTTSRPTRPHAYLTRWGSQRRTRQTALRLGSDVLVLDTQTPAITQSIAMPVEDALPPRPASMLRVGDTVMVVLQRISEDFSTEGESASSACRTGPSRGRST